MEHRLVIVSRDRPWLLDTLTSYYGDKAEVEILLDRRGDQVGARRGSGPDRRSTGFITELQTQGFMEIQQR